MRPFYSTNNHYLKFGKLVDYGTKDKDVVHVPILFEEPDGFGSTSKFNDEFSSTDKTPPKSKFKRVVQTTGATIAAIEVVPEVVDGICDKATNVIESLENVITNSMDSIANIKDNYNEKFKTTKDSTNTHKNNPELTDERDNTDDITPFSHEKNSSNLHNENKLENDGAQAIVDELNVEEQDIEDENYENDDTIDEYNC